MTLRRLPTGPDFNPDRAPIRGARITEGIGIDELFDHIRTQRHIEQASKLGTAASVFATKLGLLAETEEGETDVPTN